MCTLAHACAVKDTFNEEIERGDRDRFEILMGQELDFSQETHFPVWLRQELSKKGPYSQEVRDFLVKNSLICHEVGSGNPASDKICRVVYSDSYLGWGPIDEWISRGLGGKALFHRLPIVSKLLADNLRAILSHKGPGSSKFKIKDLGAGSGSYAFKTLGDLRNQEFPVATIDWECIDCADDALQFGRERIKEDGFSESISFTKANFMSSESFPAESDQADLIILVGVLCGMTKEDAVKCLQKIRSHAKEGAKIIAATLLVESYKEDPMVYQLLANLGWHLRPKTMAEVRAVFHQAGYKIQSIGSERKDNQGNEIPGEYAIVTAEM